MEKDEIPSVVLIRAVEPLEGIDIVLKNRNKDSEKKSNKWPSIFCQSFGITILDNEKELNETCFRIFNGKQSNYEIYNSYRIGLKEVKPKMYRFYIKDSPFISRI